MGAPGSTPQRPLQPATLSGWVLGTLSGSSPWLWGRGMRLRVSGFSSPEGGRYPVQGLPSQCQPWMCRAGGHHLAQTGLLEAACRSCSAPCGRPVPAGWKCPRSLAPGSRWLQRWPRAVVRKQRGAGCHRWQADTAGARHTGTRAGGFEQGCPPARCPQTHDRTCAQRAQSL